MNKTLIRILDENNAPVARMRLFSSGVQMNNRIQYDDSITGDRGCLACGNCIDACPVVREKRRFVFIQNQRTSMSLENIVDDECRRCYACVRVCPQVSKPAKEFVMGFRRGEKIVHNYTATLIFLLAATGIFMFHFQDIIPVWELLVLRWFHFSAGVLLIVAPLIYSVLDREHMRRTLRNMFRFGSEDLLWVKEFWAYLKRPMRVPLPSWKEFNTYHKFWTSYLFMAIALFGLTGMINFFGNGSEASLFLWLNSWVHTLLALMTDCLILLHLYFKIMRHIFRDISDMAKCMQTRGNPNYPFLYDPKAESGAFGRAPVLAETKGDNL